MEFRTQKAAWLMALVLAGALFANQYPVRREKLGKDRPGTLTVDEHGVAFEQAGKHPRHWRWAYPDIQQLTVAPQVIEVLSYQDNQWKLGADRAYRFRLSGAGSFREVYEMLKNRLDQRFVAAVADAPRPVLWQLPVKHVGGVRGSQGTLIVGSERVVYQTEAPGDSRTWRYEDIDNISSSGPFDLVITTFEHSRAHYGNRKAFTFQLKERLTEARFNDLWRRLNQIRGLEILTSIHQQEKSQ